MLMLLCVACSGWVSAWHCLQVCKQTCSSGTTLPGKWALRNKKMIDQVFNPHRVSILLAVKPGAWTTVAKELESESKSQLGTLLFSRHLDKVAAERADAKAYEDACEMMKEHAMLTTEIFEKCVDKSYATILALPGSSTIPDRRKVFNAMDVYSFVPWWWGCVYVCVYVMCVSALTGQCVCVVGMCMFVCDVCDVLYPRLIYDIAVCPSSISRQAGCSNRFEQSSCRSSRHRPSIARKFPTCFANKTCAQAATGSARTAARSLKKSWWPPFERPAKQRIVQQSIPKAAQSRACLRASSPIGA